MSRRQKEPLRPLTVVEYTQLAHLSRSHSEPAAQVARAKELLAVAEGPRSPGGRPRGESAQRRCRGPTGGPLQPRGRGGVAAQRHGGGPAQALHARAQERILARGAPHAGTGGGWDGHLVAHHVAAGAAAGPRWLARREHLHHLGRPARGWAHLGAGSQLVRDRDGAAQAQERHGDGRRSGCRSKKNLIEAAYTQEVRAGVDRRRGGSLQTVPYPGPQWHPAGKPVRYPHEYVRAGTAKQLTLFHPASGAVRVKGVTQYARTPCSIPGSKPN